MDGDEYVDEEELPVHLSTVFQDLTLEHSNTQGGV
jgi:hypothetical protein